MRSFVRRLVVGGVVLLMRLWLVGDGSLYSSTELWAADVITGGVVFWVFLALTREKLDSKQWDARVAALGTLFVVPAAVIGVLHVATPTTPQSAAVPACRGASVAGARFTATTQSIGANARLGPDVSYPQTQRFAGNCTLGFDGYCIGQPTNDLLVGEPDQRWLILHRPWASAPWRWIFGALVPRYSVVAAGIVQSQAAETKLGMAPSKVCRQIGGWPDPGPITLAGTRVHGGTVEIKARASGAKLIGLSIMSTAPFRDHSDPISAFASTPFVEQSGDLVGPWNAQTQTVPLIGQATSLLLVASVCLGPAVIDPTNDAHQWFTWTGRRLVLGARNPPSISQTENLRLQTAACSIDPNYRPQAQKQ